FTAQAQDQASKEQTDVQELEDRRIDAAARLYAKEEQLSGFDAQQLSGFVRRIEQKLLPATDEDLRDLDVQSVSGQECRRAVLAAIDRRAGAQSVQRGG
ncbi:MAG: hypothetical protein IJ072_02105, partial [Oscillospiraceae bacterium]|nr:hypothetical protein [Oscillospiraceae bacterium]